MTCRLRKTRDHLVRVLSTSDACRCRYLTSMQMEDPFINHDVTMIPRIGSSKHCLGLNADRRIVTKHCREDANDMFSYNKLPSMRSETMIAAMAVMLVFIAGLTCTVISMQIRFSRLEDLVFRMAKQDECFLDKVLGKDGSPNVRDLTDLYHRLLQSSAFESSKGQGEGQRDLLRRRRNGVDSRSRDKENFCKNMGREILNDYCRVQNNKTAPVVFKPSKSLETVVFQASFYRGLFHYGNDFKNGSKDYIEVGRRKPAEVIAYVHGTLNYSYEYSPLNIYSPAPGYANSSLAEIKDNTTGSVLIKKSGTFLININITIVDVREHNYLGLYLNKDFIWSCPRGGFARPENLKDMLKYRNCNIQGVLKMRESDTLQLKTLEKNVQIRLTERAKSVFVVVLLEEDGRA